MKNINDCKVEQRFQIGFMPFTHFRFVYMLMEFPVLSGQESDFYSHNFHLFYQQ